MAKRELIKSKFQRAIQRIGDVGRSLAADRRVKAKTKAKSGQGDHGDR